MQEDYEGSVLDAALIGAAQRVEHYEIAGYGTLRSMAETLAEDDHVSLLEETLQEEREKPMRSSPNSPRRLTPRQMQTETKNSRIPRTKKGEAGCISSSECFRSVLASARCQGAFYFGM
jgi:hypothetical protein